VAGIATWLAASGAAAVESDLHAGLAQLRAGAQREAEQHLTRYRDETADPNIRRSIDRVLPLLTRPLPHDVREYIASTIEEFVARANAGRSPGRPLPDYSARMFPVFP
jgi:hypothetical protein